ncbi:MAG: UDP-N-acetylmuramoyl-L-alanine--D-glutamate ligase [bacterium]
MMRTRLLNKKVLVCGFGKTGKAASSFLLKSGAVVSVSDIKNISAPAGIRFIPQKKLRDKIQNFDLVILSPGIDPRLDFIKSAKKKKIQVLGELEFSFKFIPRSVKIILVTGTNGKSTVATLIDRMLKAGDLKSILCGNIGTPVSGIVSRLEGDEILVIEVSSFQLERHRRKRGFPAEVRILLNAEPDHLSRYRSFAEYIKTKEEIFADMRKNDFGISGIPGLRKKNIFTLNNDIFFEGNRIKFSERLKKRFPDAEDILIQESKMTLFFQANRENIAAARGAVLPFKISAGDIRKTVYEFSPLAHRLELAGTFKERKFINDSKATNVSSVLFAVKAVTGPAVLIMGGRDKGSSYEPLIPCLKNTKKIIAYGESSGRIRRAIGGKIPVRTVTKFESALELAFGESRAGDTILLSPGCSSYDQFRNFEERGKTFKNWVKNLRQR